VDLVLKAKLLKPWMLVELFLRAKGATAFSAS